MYQKQKKWKVWVSYTCMGKGTRGFESTISPEEVMRQAAASFGTICMTSGGNPFFVSYDQDNPDGCRYGMISYYDLTTSTMTHDQSQRLRGRFTKFKQAVIVLLEDEHIQYKLVPWKEGGG